MHKRNNFISAKNRSGTKADFTVKKLLNCGLKLETESFKDFYFYKKLKRDCFVMSTDLKKVNRELLEEFIRQYQNQPCLWQIKSPEYHDRAKRDAAYNILLNKYRSIAKNADKDAVIKKINSFRTNYRREKKKVEASRRPGIATDELYEPSLWYYHLFDFLADHETPRVSSSILNDRGVSFTYYFIV